MHYNNFLTIKRRKEKAKRKPYMQHLLRSEDSPVSACKSLSLDSDPCEVF